MDPPGIPHTIDVSGPRSGGHAARMPTPRWILLPLLAACRAQDPVPPPPTPSLEGAVLGIDVSSHQGVIDWGDVAGDGVRFTFVKATEGKTFTDPRFAANWAGARRAGLKVGAYHYFSACRTGAEQARHFLAVVPPGQATLPAVVDVEPDHRCNRGRRWSMVADEVATWLDAVELATGQRPLLYASDSVHQTDLAGLEAERWVASYSRAPRVATWGVWQHTERGQVEGIDGPVDRNLATEAWWSAHRL